MSAPCAAPAEHRASKAGKISSFLLPSRVIFLLYRAALVLAFPFILAYVAFRCGKNRAYLKTLGERCGFLPPSFTQASPGAIWIHAVSVGEVISAATLIAQLRRMLPGARVFVSTSTLAGREIAGKRLAELADGGIFFAPFDYLGPVRRVLRALRPALVIVMETEIWPHLWLEARRSGAGLVVLNGRISDKAWPRYQQWRWFFAPVLGQLPTRILAQSEISRSRFVELGAEQVELGGNLKYDFDAASALAPPAVADYVAALQPGLVWVAASTMPPAEAGDVDEDEAILDLYARLARDFPRLILILVPRRPERFATAEAALRARAIPFVKRSALSAADTANAALPRVLLLDSMGELAGVFRLADVVFMGGTLCRRGGHNIVEPAFFGKPVIAGPHMENFPEIAAEFREAGACVFVENAGALEGELRRLLSNGEARAQLGERARSAAERKTGATRLAVEAARQAYEMALPRPPTSLATRMLLAPFTAMWRAGSRWRQRAGQPRAVLARPVISVGGISAGGSGKTPFALWLAEDQRQFAQRRAAFLTRGYRRVSAEACTVVPAGGPMAIEKTGDEAQLLVRSGLGPVAICADRAQAGRRLLAEHANEVDLLILDDGFQHARLARDVDIVMIDALDPFPGFDVIPAGRLREPLEALARASAFVIMRAEPGRTYDGIVATLGQYNAAAPVFRASLQPQMWVDVATGERRATLPEATRAAAFCGLGNPGSFWRSLDRLGVELVFRRAFPDHHRYHLRDLQRLAEDARAQQVETFCTTAKDAMNLPPGWMGSMAGCRVLSLAVSVRLEEAEEFRAWLERRLKTRTL